MLHNVGRFDVEVVFYIASPDVRLSDALSNLLLTLALAEA